MVSFGEAIKLGFKNTFKYGGTSTRAEYWWFTLFAFIVGEVVGLVELMFGLNSVSKPSAMGGPLSIVLSIVLFFPQLSLLVRRFRDTKVSPYWLIAGLVPIAGFATWIINHGEMFNEFLSVASLSDAETNALVDKWTNDPSVIDSLSQFAVIFLLLAAFSIFQLVVTVLPSRKPKQPVVATIDY